MLIIKFIFSIQVKVVFKKLFKIKLQVKVVIKKLFKVKLQIKVAIKKLFKVKLQVRLVIKKFFKVKLQVKVVIKKFFKAISIIMELFVFNAIFVIKTIILKLVIIQIKHFISIYGPILYF